MRGRRLDIMRVALPAAVVIASLAAVAFAQAPSRSPSPAAPAGGPPSGSPPPYQAEMDKYVADVQKSIQGKEDLPSKEVFKNVKMLGDVPASRLLRTMQGFTHALGVNCTKCHVADHWDSEEKEGKEVTRDMMKMTRAINDDYIKTIKALAEDKPSVNCFTCHRGDQHAGVQRPPRQP